MKNCLKISICLLLAFSQPAPGADLATLYCRQAIRISELQPAGDFDGDRQEKWKVSVAKLEPYPSSDGGKRCKLGFSRKFALLHPKLEEFVKVGDLVVVRAYENDQNLIGGILGLQQLYLEMPLNGK